MGASSADSIVGSELRAFVERIEAHEREKADAAELVKETYAELKGRGFDTKVVRRIVSDRKKSPDEIAEEEAILEMYRAALGMKV